MKGMIISAVLTALLNGVVLIITGVVLFFFA
jgi:hypothetical protein